MGRVETVCCRIVTLHQVQSYSRLTLLFYFGAVQLPQKQSFGRLARAENRVLFLTASCKLLEQRAKSAAGCAARRRQSLPGVSIGTELGVDPNRPYRQQYALASCGDG